MIDVVKNSQVKDFVDFLKGGNMVVVNGRKGRDAYTCVSDKGCSVVDYCLVENEKMAVAIDKVCTDPAVGRAMERLCCGTWCTQIIL